MKDKDKSPQKKSPGSKGSPGVRRTGSGSGMCRSGAAVPAGSSVQQTATAQVTERMRSEDALKESEERYRLLTELSPDMIAIHQEGRFMFINKAGLRMLGADRPEQLLGKLVLDVIHPDYRDIVRVRVKRGIQEGIKASFIEEVFIRCDGTEVPVEVTGLPFVYKGGPAMIVIARDITARKKSELALKQSEEKYRRLYNETPVLLHSIDRDARLVDVNDYWLKTMGYELNECIGRKVTDFYTDASRKYAQEVIQPAFFRDGSVKDISYQFIKKNGEVLDVLLSATAERDASGNVVRSLAVIEDITERKRVEEALQKSERMLQTIIDTEPDCIKVIDEESRLIMMNRAGLNMIQANSLDEVRGQFVCPLVAPEYQQAFMDLTRQVFQGGSGSMEFRMVGMRGSQLWLETHAVPLRNEKDEIIALLGVTRDITGRKQVEEKISTFSADLQRLLSVSREMTATTDIAGLYRAAVQTAVDLLRFDFSTVMVLSDDRSMLAISDSIGFPASMIGNFHLLEGQGLATYALKNMTPEFVVDFRTETRFDVPAIVRDLHIRSALCVPMMLEDRVFGVLIGHTLGQREFSREDIAIYQSIGNQAAIAITNAMNVQALRENRARLDLALQSAHMGVWRWEIKEDKRYFDDLTCQILGIEAKTFYGNVEDFYRAVHPDDRVKVKAALARTLEQDVPYEPSYRVVWPDGSVHYITSRGRLVRDDRGQPMRFNGILWDITDQRRVEQELIETEKLESIGTLAGGIAHDFNNLLQGVFGFISMAKLTFDQKEKSLAMLAQAEKALHQSVNLTSQLLTFSKGGKPVKKVLALRPLIENSVAFALSGSRVTYEIVVGENLRAVEADEGQIGQVIQNIALNADQAMPLGGTIRVSVRNIPAASVVPHVDLQGDLVEISIHDQGTGIPAEHLTRIFDPYFTTKEKGSGLGLATSYSIIKNHGGLVRVQSEVGKGTIFFIYLPASGAQGEETSRPAMPSTRKGRILVMDDEEIIRAVASEMLTAIGHDVAFAETGEQALDVYRAARDAGSPFDVVILDLTIRGGMGGMETLRELREIDPDVKAVVSSGYSDDAALSNYREQGFRAFLKKPYNMEELQSALNALLA